MEYCDHGCLSDAIKCGVFRAVEGQWDKSTSLRSLVRTAKEIAQVGGRDGGQKRLEQLGGRVPLSPTQLRILLGI